MSSPTQAEAAAAEAAAATGGLWTSLMDAAAAWDIALLPLLGAGGPAAEAAAARAGSLLEGYARGSDGGESAGEGPLGRLCVRPRASNQASLAESRKPQYAGCSLVVCYL
jgi:hypothetical protein